MHALKPKLLQKQKQRNLRDEAFKKGRLERPFCFLKIFWAEHYKAVMLLPQYSPLYLAWLPPYCLRAWESGVGKENGVCK